MKVKRVRGGARFSYARHARCTFRDGRAPVLRGLSVSFRCCFSPSFMIKRKDK